MIVCGAPERVAKWVLERIPGSEIAHANGQWYQAIGFAKSDGVLCGGVLYYNWHDGDIEASAAGEGHWLTPLNLKIIFLYPFGQLGCRRMTALVARNNKRSRRFVERLGFKLEGVKRAALPDGRDQFIYGLLKKECRWIDHEQRIGPEGPEGA